VVVPRSAGGRVGLVGAIVPAVALIVAGTWLYDMHERAVPPDVRSVAQSTAVQEADAAATNAVSAGFGRLVEGAGWLVPGPSAVIDSCASQPPDAIGGSYSPVVCVRSVARFYGFDGVFAQRYASLAADLAASGRHGSDPVQATTAAHLFDAATGPGGTEPEPLRQVGRRGLGRAGLRHRGLRHGEPRSAGGRVHPAVGAGERRGRREGDLILTR
jgi:hypothetical protein